MLQPEQEPKEEPSFEAQKEIEKPLAVETEGLDEVAVQELRALKEMSAESLPEEGFLEQATRDADASSTLSTDESVVAEAPKDEVMLQVEKILEEDLEPLVESMSSEDRAKFEKKGLEVSGQIAGMVRSFKLKMEKAVSLIRSWLHTIPGVNKFFLEQEAKIKADKIMDLEEARRSDQQNIV